MLEMLTKYEREVVKRVYTDHVFGRIDTYGEKHAIQRIAQKWLIDPARYHVRIRIIWLLYSSGELPHLLHDYPD